MTSPTHRSRAIRRWSAATAFATLTACGSDDMLAAPRLIDCISPAGGVAVTHYHGGRDKLGGNRNEVELSPTAVRRAGLGIAWESPRFDAATIDGVSYAAHVYASPLYVDDLAIEGGPYAGADLSTVITATSNGWVYAVNAGEAAGDCGVVPGEVLWASQIAEPMVVEKLDGGMPMGVLSTPVVDLETKPQRLYVAALDRVEGWQLHALNAGTGAPLPGWPVDIRADDVEAANTNGPARFWSADTMSQRGALTTSPTGDTVYVPFGTFWGEGVGWLVAVDVGAQRIAASFSSAPWTEPKSNGGIWGSAGPTVAEDGDIWLTTGNGPPQSGTAADTWASSLLRLAPDLEPRRIYTPANYCILDGSNLDLGASQPLLLPDQRGSTPHLVAFGGKQGVVYLVDRDAMSEPGVGRPPCQRNMAGDASLHPPRLQPYWPHPGPLHVFGPYSDVHGQIDHAKMRTKLAYHRDGNGQPWLFASGSSKRSPSSTVSVPPSLAKLRVATSEDEPAHLAIESMERTITFANPGPPMLTSDQGDDAIVWVLDANAPRTASLVDPATPGPVLYAFSADDLTPLWRSTDGQLARAGKYATVVAAHGHVMVGTDRIVAFGLPGVER